MGLRNLFIFPGHNYLGPGNKLASAPPVDTDDLIAQEHDLAYECAEEETDIFKADEKAIFAFIFDWIRNKNWHSGVGAIGLGLKHLTEMIIGKVLYPKIQKGKD